MPNYVAHCLVIIGALCCTMVGTFFPLFLNGSADWQRPDKQRHWDARVSGAADHGCTLQAMGGKSRLGDIRVRVECNIFAKSVLVGRILIADHSMGDGRGSRSSNASPRLESPGSRRRSVRHPINQGWCQWTSCARRLHQQMPHCTQQGKRWKLVTALGNHRGLPKRD